MPCNRYQAALYEETSENGVKLYTWQAVRRQHLRMLRKQTRSIVLFMALLEIMRVGIVDLVYRGKHETQAPGSEDYGIAYNAAYLIGWIYMCLLAIIYVPLFSWWVPKLFSSSTPPDSSANDPSTPSSPTFSEKLCTVLQNINAVLLPVCIVLSLLQHIYFTISTFIHVDAKPVDPAVKSPVRLNTRRAWRVRVALLCGIVSVMCFGKGVLMILERTDLARVKTLEYFVILVPIQVNLGILFASALQLKAEQRRARKEAARLVQDAEVGREDEKQRLI